jgi:hypothetical protein
MPYAALSDIQMTQQIKYFTKQSKHTIQLHPGKLDMKFFQGQLHTTHAVLEDLFKYVI